MRMSLSGTGNMSDFPEEDQVDCTVPPGHVLGSVQDVNSRVEEEGRDASADNGANASRHNSAGAPVVLLLPALDFNLRARGTVPVPARNDNLQASRRLHVLGPAIDVSPLPAHDGSADTGGMREVGFGWNNQSVRLHRAVHSIVVSGNRNDDQNKDEVEKEENQFTFCRMYLKRN